MLRPGKKCKNCSGVGCKACHNRGFIIKPPKPRKRVKPISKKRVQQQRDYTIQRQRFLLKYTQCQALTPTGQCPAKAVECHHRAGRHGSYYLDETTWMALCKKCHSDIHEKHQNWARHHMRYLVNPISKNPVPPISDVFIPYDTPTSSDIQFGGSRDDSR